MDLIVHQVMELHHIDLAHDHLLIEGPARLAIVQDGLPPWGQTCLLEEVLDVLFRSPIEDGGGHMIA
jgi:hypothetical protein